jgi:hypothetical protein
MCDAPNTAVFLIESQLIAFLVLFPDVFNPLVIIPVAPVNTGMAKHSTFAEFLYLDFYILTSFQTPFPLRSYPITLLC